MRAPCFTTAADRSINSCRIAAWTGAPSTLGARRASSLTTSKSRCRIDTTCATRSARSLVDRLICSVEIGVRAMGSSAAGVKYSCFIGRSVPCLAVIPSQVRDSELPDGLCLMPYGRRRGLLSLSLSPEGDHIRRTINANTPRDKCPQAAFQTKHFRACMLRLGQYGCILCPAHDKKSPRGCSTLGGHTRPDGLHMTARGECITSSYGFTCVTCV